MKQKLFTLGTICKNKKCRVNLEMELNEIEMVYIEREHRLDITFTCPVCGRIFQRKIGGVHSQFRK